MAPDDQFSFHTFELNALAEFVAVVVALTQSNDPELDTLLNRLLAEHGVKDIEAFNGNVGEYLEEIERGSSRQA
jgi:hypothetical protein